MVEEGRADVQEVGCAAFGRAVVRVMNDPDGR
jgi:hypothetical protein